MKIIKDISLKGKLKYVGWSVCHSPNVQLKMLFSKLHFSNLTRQVNDLSCLTFFTIQRNDNLNKTLPRTGTLVSLAGMEPAALRFPCSTQTEV